MGKTHKELYMILLTNGCIKNQLNLEGKTLKKNNREERGFRLGGYKPEAGLYS
jgi:hypothetical protein